MWKCCGRRYWLVIIFCRFVVFFIFVVWVSYLNSCHQKWKNTHNLNSPLLVLHARWCFLVKKTYCSQPYCSQWSFHPTTAQSSCSTLIRYFHDSESMIFGDPNLVLSVPRGIIGVHIVPPTYLRFAVVHSRTPTSQRHLNCILFECRDILQP